MKIYSHRTSFEVQLNRRKSNKSQKNQDRAKRKLNGRRKMACSSSLEAFNTESTALSIPLAGDRHRFATQIVEFPWESTTEQVRLVSSFVKLLQKFHGSGRSCGSLPFFFFQSIDFSMKKLDNSTFSTCTVHNCLIIFSKIKFITKLHL